MSEPLKAAFIFVAPGGDPAQHRALVETPGVQLLTVAAKNYEAAAELAKELVADGFQAIELCGGFGNLGVAKIVEAVQGKVPVGGGSF